MHHVDGITEVCNQFVEDLLRDICPKDIRSNLWSRNEVAVQELKKIMKDIKSYPINYNHYYTDTINNRRQAKDEQSLTKCMVDATISLKPDTESYARRVFELYTERRNPDIKTYRCQEALDCVFSIYEVC